MNNTRTLTFTAEYNARAAHLYRAFSSSQGYQEWFSDVAAADARPGGRFYGWWNPGFYVVGVFKEVVEGQSVRFTWHASGEPAPTEVYVRIEEVESGVRVTLEHSGLGEGEAWDQVEENFKREWTRSLAHLKKVIETGVDERIYERPMLGFWIGGLVDKNMQARKSLPVDYGIHVSGVLEGMGAEQSGLKADDILAEVDGTEIRSYQDIDSVLSGHKGGDVVSTVIYRGQEKIALDVALSRRPVPDYPPVPEQLARQARKEYKKVFSELKKALKGRSEADASRRPAEGEWSAKEAMAHLLVSERWSQAALDVHVGGGKMPAYPGSKLTIEAIAAQYKSKRLYKELKRQAAINLHMIENLPAEYYENKAAYFLMMNNYTTGIETHFREHVSQIKKAFEEGEAKG